MEEELANEEQTQESAGQYAEAEIQTSDPEDDGTDEKTEINRLLDEGYNAKQIIELGFKRSTVYHHAKKRAKPEKPSASPGGTDVQAVMLPAKLDGRQAIAPEYIIKHLSFVDNGHRQTFVDALLVWEAARRSVMEDMVILQGLSTAQAQITETQLRILHEAKNESREIADAAAQRAASIVGGQLGDMIQRSNKPTAPDPFSNMFAQAMQPVVQQAFGGMLQAFSRFMPGMMPGMMGSQAGAAPQVGQPPQPGQAFQPGQPPQPGPTGQGPGFGPQMRTVSQEEMEDVFNAE